jgi:hypothetical protein
VSFVELSIGHIMKKTMDGNPTQLHTDLMQLTNTELVSHGFEQPSATLLENELLHRLEAYIEMYGDFLETKR